MRGDLYIASHSPRKLVFVMVAVLFAAVFFVVFPTPDANAQISAEWTRQFGSSTTTPGGVLAVDVAADGNVYVVGHLAGVLPGATSAGGTDVYLRKYDSGGNEVWTRQFGTFLSENAVGVDVESGNIFVTGITEGWFPGTPKAGGAIDVFVRAYDSNGNVLWTDEIGSEFDDMVSGIIADSSGIYISGFTDDALPNATSSGDTDAFIVKYSTGGSRLWTRQFGSSGSDEAFAMHLTGTSIFIGGLTDGTLPGAVGTGEFFVQEYDTSGDSGFTGQFELPEGGEIMGVSANATGIYVAGSVNGTLPGQTSFGDTDAFVQKYDSGGNEIWTRQFGTSAFDQTLDVLANNNGVYVAGVTEGILPGQSGIGELDIFIRKYSDDGSIIWTSQSGTTEDDGEDGMAIAVFGTENYITGSTLGEFPGESQTEIGTLDAFLQKLQQDDTDNDGIFDEIDLLPATFSDDFDDGATTTGTIASRGNQINLAVQDATSSPDGVVAETDLEGSNPRAKITACGSNFFLSAGDKIVITCGSVVAQVTDGDGVEIEFIADDGTLASTTLPSGNTIIFDTEEATFSALPGESVTIIVDGNPVVLEPGELLQYVVVDVKPSNGASCVNPDANGVIPVAIMSSALFNASDVNPLTVTLEGATVRVKGKSDNMGTLKDVDGDGDIDLLLQIENEIALREGQSTVTLTGMTFDEDDIVGSDSICVVPPTG